MGSSTTPTIFSRPGTIGLLLVSAPKKILDGKTFTSNEGVKNAWNQIFACNDQNFIEHGIMILPEK